MSRQDASSPPPDPAAAHGRRLLAALDVGTALPDRPDALPPDLEWAASGAMALTGEPDGPPRFASGGLASAARGVGLALAGLLPGHGFEALDAPALLGERAALFGLARRGRATCGGSGRLLPSRGESLALNLPRDDDWRLLEAWLECPLPGVAAARDWSAIESAVAARAPLALVERGRELGLAVALAVRAPRRAAPPFRITGETRSQPRATPPRVLDLSALWAGPLAGALLVQAGSPVLKLESPARPDGARLAEGAGEREFFDLLNAGKDAAALALADPGDRGLFARLLESADVVLESARPRALAQLGFDAAAWVAARPGRIWASITGHGREHEWIAFGDDAAVAAGLAFDPGASSGRPRFCADAVADPLTGLYAALAITALWQQGRGGLLALALSDVAAHAALAGGGEGAAVVRRSGAGRDDWAVVAGERVVPVAPPRARSTSGRAAALRPPDPALLARWTEAC